MRIVAVSVVLAGLCDLVLGENTELKRAKDLRGKWNSFDLNFKSNRQPIRWRSSNGNLTTHLISTRDLFVQWGDVFVRKDAWLSDDSWTSEPVISETWYVGGTNWLTSMARLLSEWTHQVSNQSLNSTAQGNINQRQWRYISAQLNSDKFEDEYLLDVASIFTSDSQGDLETEFGLLCQSKLRDVFPVLRRHLSLLKATVNMMTRIELGGNRTTTRSNGIEPHPEFLKWTDLDSRINSLETIERSLTRFATLSFDFSFATDVIKNMKSDKNDISNLVNSYKILLNIFGNRFDPVSKTQRIRAAQTLATLRALPQKLSKGGGKRPDGFQSTIKLNYAPQPTVKLQIRMGKQSVKLLHMGEIEGLDSARVGENTKRKFTRYLPLVETSLREELALLLFLTADQSTQFMLHQKKGASVVMQLRTEIRCLYSRENRQARVLELLYGFIPSLTDTAKIRSRERRELKDVPDTDSRAWILLGVTYDSLDSTNVEEQNSGRLVQLYLRDRAEQKGVMVDYPGEFRDFAAEPTCVASPLFEVVAGVLADGHLMCASIPQGFDAAAIESLAYPVCLDRFPSGTTFVISGQKGFSRRPKEHPINAELWTVKMGKKIPKKSENSNLLQIDDIYDTDDNDHDEDKPHKVTLASFCGSPSAEDSDSGTDKRVHSFSELFEVSSASYEECRLQKTLSIEAPKVFKTISLSKPDANEWLFSDLSIAEGFRGLDV